MARYIKATECADIISGRFYIRIGDLVDAFADVPSADVMEVVRCKYCKYWQDNNGGYPHKECRWNENETPNTDDYCSYGERIDE